MRLRSTAVCSGLKRFMLSAADCPAVAWPRIDQALDLTGLYAVPPFGDTHTHLFDNPQTTPQLVRRYLEEGTFYAKVVTEPRSRALLSSPMVNRPDSVDVIYAHGGLTSSFSHPIEVYEAVALGYEKWSDAAPARELDIVAIADGEFVVAEVKADASVPDPFLSRWEWF